MCACNSGNKNSSPSSYVHTAPGGKKTTYRSEIEAQAAKQAQGGTVTPQR